MRFRPLRKNPDPNTMKAMSNNRPVWSNQTKLIVTLVLLVLLAYLLQKFGSMAVPLILAVILAYVLTPAVNFLQAQLHIRRIFAILITYLMMFMVIGVALMLLVPMLVRQGTDIGVEITAILTQATILLGDKYTIGGMTIDGQMLLDQFSGSIQTFLQPIFGSTITIVKDILSSLAWVVFIIVISLYLIKDTVALQHWVEGLVPEAYRPDFHKLRKEITTIWASFFRGQIVLGLVVAALITTVYFTIGLRSAVLMGALAGLLEFMPSIGHGIWLCIALPLAFFGGSTWLPLSNWAFTLLVLGLHIVFEQFDTNYLIPRIIGRSVRLPPLVVILGILAGASLAGVLGVMLAAPTIASLRVLGRYIYAEIVNAEPFPNEMVEPLPPPDPMWWRRSSEKANRPTEIE
jgi:predicted PurR-regulated permease PerM